MRERENRSAGRGWKWALAAVAAGVVVVGLSQWPAADATPSRAEKLETICASPGSPGRKAVAVEGLRDLRSTDARNRLIALADHAEETVAILSLSALGRSSGTAAVDKLESVFESTGRSNAVRAAALAAWCERQNASSRTWDQSGVVCNESPSASRS